jgi:ubiquinone/menaquinone biosynthesis C-methylase UbiE
MASDREKDGLAHDTHFTDGAAYERFMGRWSRAAGAVFLDWVAPPGGARWLDIGCGTGVFTELVLDTCSPATVVAVDPSPAQIELARSKPVAQRADFRVADAQTLPFSDGAFDVVASALVINFIPDRPRALAEMCRVARTGGVVAGYVWDFAEEGSPGSPIRSGLIQIGAKPPLAAGTEDSRLEALRALFAGGGLKDIATKTIEVTMSFENFNDFWRRQTPSYSPLGKVIAGLSKADREKLMEAVRTGLSVGPDGSIVYSARANAIKARVPE